VKASILGPKDRIRFVRFAIVGAIGAIIDFGVFNFLSQCLNVVPVWSSIFSFTAAVISNFMLNRYWTYPDSRSKPLPKQLTQFSIISIIGLIIRTPLFMSLEKPLLLVYSNLFQNMTISLDAVFWGYNTALAIAIIVVMFWNFFANRYLTYNDVD
jgi:putative flippase GtrA